MKNFKIWNDVGVELGETLSRSEALNCENAGYIGVFEDGVLKEGLVLLAGDDDKSFWDPISPEALLLEIEK